ncbi:Hypothetical protein FKW44_000863 [Caligus rogercresseyi]|uniref:Uncharacterized protein n=1 Tax=Caligus rogercresseyi TaxID=217165 RepID=A0A7T8KHX2_CALRO|nr:Hypothetical protein FKW44_000863 [Caligus rogercresseyi]
MDRKKLQMGPLSEEIKSEEGKLKKLEEEVSKLTARIEEKKAKALKTLNRAQEYCLELEKLTGSRRVGEELKAQWEEAGVPEDVDRIEEDLDGLQAESACIGNINRSVVEEYLRLKDSVSSLEESIASKVRIHPRSKRI